MDYKDLAEYLLQIYADYTEMYEDALRENSIFLHYYSGRADTAFMILQEKLEMQIDETETEYIARNSKYSVKVEKEK